MTQAKTRRALTALFAVYLLLLGWTVLWKLGMPYIGGGKLRTLNLAPFSGSRPLELAFNLAVFVPFGLYTGALLPRLSPIGRAALAAAASLLLEGLQYAMAVGRSDITDVIVNTLGAVLGAAIYSLAKKRLGERAGRALLVACAIGTALTLLAAAYFITHFRFREMG